MDNQMTQVEIETTVNSTNSAKQETSAPAQVCTPSELVPEDEREVTEEISLPDEQPIEVTLVASPEGMVPINERAIAEDICMEKFEDARAAGFFSAAVGMAQITNRLNGVIHAAVHVDAKGERTVQFCERYPDGRFSPKVTVKQSILLLASINNFAPDAIPASGLKKKISKFVADTAESYLGTYSDDGIPLNPIEILKALASARNSLPVVQDGIEVLPAEKLYIQIETIMRSWIYNPLTEPKGPKSYAILADFQIESLAKSLGMKENALLRLLKEYHFLYLTESSVGYQTRVRFGKDENGKDVLDWCYCLFKTDYIGERAKQAMTKK